MRPPLTARESLSAESLPPSQGGTTGGSGGGEMLMMPGACEANTYEAVRLVYAQNGRTVNYLMREEWCWDPAQPTSCPTDYAVTRIEHDRYDGPRHRYLPRVLDPVNLFVLEELAP